ncbi:MAG TPA: phosphotransferase, partial [Roseiflexaceae bacterium]|nr:phosphotransferase [Roseiflexaceae bacterium]
AYDLSPPIAHFQLDGAGSNNATIGIRAGQREFVLKTYEATADRAAIQYEHALLAQLGAFDLPFAIPVPLRTRSGETLVGTERGLQALFPRLSGTQANRSDPRQVEAAGAALAQLHLALATLPLAPHPAHHSYAALDLIHPRMRAPADIDPAEFDLSYNRATMLIREWQGELAALEQFVRDEYARLPRQIVHGDYACANVLWHAGQVSAVIDFEFALPDARAIDLAALIDLVARPWEGPVDPKLVDAAYAGYTRHTVLTSIERLALPRLMRLRGAVSAIWWAGRHRATGKKLDAERFEAVLARKMWLDLDNVQF